MKKFINFSNHPSDKWTQLQLLSAQEYGEVIDMPFPLVDESLSNEDVVKLAKKYVNEIENLTDHHPCTMHVMGEMTFTFTIVNMLKERGYLCVASTSQRIVEELPDGVKNVRFEFCQFREY